MKLPISCVDPHSIVIPKKPPHKSASEHRKATKPIMEKRRRARINGCLDQIKSLVLTATNRDPAKHAKLEKADILEMTVNFLRDITLPGTTLLDKSSAIKSLRSGFDECAQEIERFDDTEMDLAMKRRLVNHLKNSNFNTNHNNNNLVSSTTSSSLSSSSSSSTPSSLSPLIKNYTSSPILIMKSEPNSPHHLTDSQDCLSSYTPPPSGNSSNKTERFFSDNQYHNQFTSHHIINSPIEPYDDGMDCKPVDCSKSSKLVPGAGVWRPW